MFSTFVNTLKADFDAIKDDMTDLVETVKVDASEFVSTVKQDAGQVLGMAKKQFAATSSSSRFPSWEEQLWDNPTLLSEDPKDEDWLDNLTPLKQEEIEMFLAATDGIVPELYKELVPEKTTHEEFFKRLAFHRNRLTQQARQQAAAAAARQEEEEEEEGWDDDESILKDSAPTTTPSVAELLGRIAELEQALKASEEKCASLEARLAASSSSDPLPHKKKPVEPTKQPPLPAEEASEEAPAKEVASEAPIAETPTKPLAEEDSKVSSWEALSDSISPSPNLVKEEEIVEKTPAKASAPELVATLEKPRPQVSLDDDEEDDWE